MKKGILSTCYLWRSNQSLSSNVYGLSINYIDKWREKCPLSNKSDQLCYTVRITCLEWDIEEWKEKSVSLAFGFVLSQNNLLNGIMKLHLHH